MKIDKIIFIKISWKQIFNTLNGELYTKAYNLIINFKNS